MNWLGVSITLMAIGIYQLQRKKKRGGAPTPGRRRSSVNRRLRANSGQSEANSQRNFARFLKGESSASHAQRAVELDRLVVRGDGGMTRANSLDLSEAYRFDFPDEVGDAGGKDAAAMDAAAMDHGGQDRA